ncbi:hypothetical protein WJX72_011022 [[Myrmecia] bisecta]|uniref:Enoyl reductase (ER) domain-containing protein n=1 Tax=[Myrmecia] bisecta TaxID=41462 RepID=A0AAW1Q118_9CHLO
MAVAGWRRLPNLLQQISVRSLSSSALPEPIWQPPDEEASPSTNTAAMLYGPNDLRYVRLPLGPRPPPQQVRLEMKAVGICGSDVHYVRKGRLADFVVESPLVLGHESAGRIIELGEGVKGLKVGDRVAVEAGIPCWDTALSRTGRYNLCPRLAFHATPPHHGSMAQFIDHPATFCYKLPDSLSYEQGAMCEPLSVGIHAVQRAKVQPGMNVAVLGAGPIGLMALLGAKAFGADDIAISDIKTDNLELATSLGASVAICQSRGASPADVAAQIRAALPPRGPDVVIDCVGFDSTVQTALEACNPGGKVVLLGLGQDGMHQAPLALSTTREIDLIGSFRYNNTYPICLHLMKSRRVDVLPLITHRFSFDEDSLAAAFDTAARAAETKSIKVMFNLGDQDD